MTRLLFLFCSFFVIGKSIVTYKSTISVENITGESGLKFKPNAFNSLKFLSNNECSICFRFMLKQNKHVVLLEIGESLEFDFGLEIWIERDDKTILQVRTSNDHIEQFNWFIGDSDINFVALNFWHHFCFAIEKSRLSIILVWGHAQTTWTVRGGRGVGQMSTFVYVGGGGVGIMSTWSFSPIILCDNF